MKWVSIRTWALPKSSEVPFEEPQSLGEALECSGRPQLVLDLEAHRGMEDSVPACQKLTAPLGRSHELCGLTQPSCVWCLLVARGCQDSEAECPLWIRVRMEALTFGISFTPQGTVTSPILQMKRPRLKE